MTARHTVHQAGERLSKPSGETKTATKAAAAGHHHAWMAYQIATARLALAGILPRALMSFLDDAHRLGLLRTVGPIYQFRHAELQDHLATLPTSLPPTWR
ncbi:hypothetical protein ABT120_42425 [Nonomuraea angiospora]|uniref:hypothetical protein n=1 Tax=Nonomuraea angiospora TaxID=46172 RepID=UPI0033273EDF